MRPLNKSEFFAIKRLKWGSTTDRFYIIIEFIINDIFNNGGLLQ